MFTFNLYWNHICVLHKQEQALLEKLKLKLKQQNIELNITYFGLGYPEHLSEYLLREDAVLPDLIVSADLEVFEYDRLWQKIQHCLLPLNNIPVYHSNLYAKVERETTLLPYTGIPLVYYSTDENFVINKDIAQQKLALGGIDNSAIKTVAKYLLETVGKEQTATFLADASIHPMPIVAYQQVRMKQLRNIKTALVPSIYAMRANQRDSFLHIPQGGPLVIPSYICAFKQSEEERENTLRTILLELLSEEFTDFYAQQGDLLIFSSKSNVYPAKYEEMQVPSAAYLTAQKGEDFYDFYVRQIPQAKDYREIHSFSR